MILSIETSTRAFSVSLYKDGQIANIELVHEIAHSQNIVHTVNFLLKSINKSVEDLSAVYAGKGPGSFTGIRVGLSYANTLFQIMGIPLLGIPSLDLLAFEEGRWYNSVISFIKSRKNEVYAAAYRQGRRVSDYLALKKDDFSYFIKENKLNLKYFFCTHGHPDHIIGLPDIRDQFPEARTQTDLDAIATGLKAWQGMQDNPDDSIFRLSERYYYPIGREVMYKFNKLT